MSIGADLGGLAGGVAGLFGDDGSGAASKYYKELAEKYGALNPKITQAVQGNSELGKADQSTRNGQMDVLRNLQGIYGQGGLDAIGRSRVAGAETEANRNATASANAIGERARASGAGGSGVTLALQQQAGQEGANRVAQEGLGAAAVGEQNRNAALGTAGVVAGATRGQDYQSAAAQDAINNYNSRMNMATQQSSFDNSMSQLGGEGGAYGAGYAAKQQGYKNTVGAAGQVGSGLGGAADDLGSYFDAQKLKGG